MIKFIIFLSVSLQYSVRNNNSWWALSDPSRVEHHMLLCAPDSVRPCKHSMGLSRFFPSLHESRSWFSVTPHGLGFPDARCVLAKGRAVSAFCPASCKCCPRPPDLPELSLSGHMPLQHVDNYRYRERIKKTDKKGKKESERKKREAGVGCGAKDRKLFRAVSGERQSTRDWKASSSNLHSIHHLRGQTLPYHFPFTSSPLAAGQRKKAIFLPSVPELLHSSWINCTFEMCRSGGIHHRARLSDTFSSAGKARRGKHFW